MRLIVGSLRSARALVGTERAWRWFALVVLAAAVGAFEAVGALLVYALIALVAAPGDVGGLPVIGPLVTGLDVPVEIAQTRLAAAVVAFFAVRALVVVGQAYVRSRIVENAGATLSVRLLEGYLGMPYLFHVTQNSSELIRNAYSSTHQFVHSVLHPLVVVAAEGAVVVAMVAVLVLVAPAEALLSAVLMGTIGGLTLLYVQPRLRDYGRTSQDERAASLKSLQQGLGGLRDIRLLRREREFARSFADHRFAFARADYMRLTLSHVPRAVIEAGLIITIAALFLVAVLREQGGQAVLSTLGVFAYSGLRLQPSAQRILTALTDLRFSGAVLDDLTADVARVNVVTGAQPPSRRSEFSQSIRLEDVSFRYPGAGVVALSHVSLEVPKGSFVGIAGPTGSGKSTLVDVIAGLIPPTSGRVVIDGTDVGTCTAWWWEQLGVVSQSVFLTDDTVANNIAFGADAADVDNERLVNAARAAQLGPVIDGLPAKWETLVGERGVKLSGGQRQRVALARALYHMPPVLILDEGTAALDPETERAVVGAIESFRADRTLIVVAHRLATLQHADLIYVLRDGLLSTQGTYDELSKTDPLFQVGAQS